MKVSNSDIHFSNAPRYTSFFYIHLRTGCVLFFLLHLLAGQHAVAATDLTLGKTLEQASHRADFVQPTPSELSAFYDTAKATFAGEDPLSVLKERWMKIGWEVAQLTINDNTVWLIYQPAQSRRGAGVFAVRPNADNEILLEAPHSFYDKFTRPIVVRMFERSNFRAAAWNSVHRRVQDVAHDEDSFFHEFTRAFLDAESKQKSSKKFVIQAHGYSQKSRKTSDGAAAEIIISNGTRFPPRWLRMLNIEMKAVARGVKLFPTQVGELGATTNVQSKLARQSGGEFLHIECCDPVRRKLRRRTAVIDELLKCILNAYRIM